MKSSYVWRFTTANDPKEFRKQAAKEFVGALVEDDRAGVVDFDGDAHVAQELTTDFGKVNLTIEDLDANGGTDIGDGVREANQHFAEASNDSRAQVAILLTDGQGSGGRAEARTAARRNTTIYTIGFGGADGNKLQDIARITDGNYTYVDEPSDLPNVFSRVADDIGAQDSDGDGIPDAVERRGVVTPQLGTVKTDPYSADTDGDGLTDGTELGPGQTGEEVRERRDDGPNAPAIEKTHETVSEAGYNVSNITGTIYFTPSSDPTRVHTDGDGLDDYTEREEESTIVKTTSVSATRAAKEGSSRDGLASAYETKERGSNPWRADSDDDGLDDARERELATSPISPDTDGDGIEDSDEVEGAGDPTLYDDRPPEIEVIDSGQDVSKNGVRYWAHVRLHDPAGIGYATLVKNDNKEGKKPFYSDGTIVTTLDFTEGFAESETDIDRSSWKSIATSGGSKGLEIIGSATGTAGDIAVGTRVYVEATDRNENRGRVVALQQPNAYSEIIGFTAGSPIDPFVARHAGTLSGFSASVGVPLQDVSQLIDDPSSFTEGIENLLELIKEEQIAAPVTLVKVMVQDAQQKQALNNPYDKDENSRAYKLFRDNWYAGFAGGYFVLTYGTGGASAGAKSAVETTKSAQKVSSKLADTKALRALSRISDAKKAAKSRATARILMTVDGNAPEPLLSSADTAGGAYRLWRLQRGMDADVDSLPEAKQTRLGKYLIRTEDAGVDVTEQLDAETLDSFLETDADFRETLTAVNHRHDDFDAAQFLRETDGDSRRALERVDDATATRILVRYGEGDLDADHLRRIDGLLDSGDMDQADLQRMMGILETKEHDPLVDGDIDAKDLLDTASRGNGLEDTLGVFRRDGEIRTFSTGDKEAGWDHIKQRHVEGTYKLDAEGGTGVFPVGKTVKGEELPNTMSERDVQKMIHDAIKDGESTPQGEKTKYYLRPEKEGYPDSGINDMRVIVFPNGEVETAYPLSGPAVKRWVPELDDGEGGFVDTA